MYSGLRIFAQGLRTNVLSTRCRPMRVFVVDMVFSFAMSYLAFAFVMVVVCGLPFTYWPDTAIIAFMAVMAVCGGATGACSASSLQKRSFTRRSAIASIVGSIVFPTFVVVVVSGFLTDFDGTVALLACVGPALSVFGYRYLGFQEFPVRWFGGY